MRLIGLHAQLGSGKDTVYEMINKESYGRSVERIAFADKLKMSAMLALGLKPCCADEAIVMANDLKEEEIHIGQDDMVKVITGRQYLQWYGTEAHRQVFGDNFWVDMLLPLDLNPDIMADIVVVTDVRFSNEAKRIRTLGGEVWYIDATERLPEREVHASEQMLPNELIDWHVDNNGTLDNLEHEVRMALSYMGVLDG